MFNFLTSTSQRFFWAAHFNEQETEHYENEQGQKIS